jgi:tetratricopeptide (TPR) repeat protein
MAGSRAARAMTYCPVPEPKRGQSNLRAHPKSLLYLNNLGSLLLESGELQEAELAYREALDGRRQVLGNAHLLGNAHRDTLVTFNNLGALLRERGDFSSAVEILDEAVATLDSTSSSPTHPAGRVRFQHGMSLFALERYGEAEI